MLSTEYSNEDGWRQHTIDRPICRKLHHAGCHVLLRSKFDSFGYQLGFVLG